SDASFGHGPSIGPEMEMYSRAANSGHLVGRITLMPQIQYVAAPDSNEVREPAEFKLDTQPEWLRIGATKIFADGALTTRTAALRHPFADSSSNRGIPIWEQDQLDGMILRAHRAGWQIATHAIGDRAIEMVLGAYEAAFAA